MRKPYYKCIDCGKDIWVKNGRCRSCEMKYRQRKPEFHWNYQKGKPKCLDCGKQLTDYRSKRCESCANKGQLNGYYKQGLPKCKICGKELKRYEASYCKICMWKNPEIRERILKASFEVMSDSFNKVFARL